MMMNKELQYGLKGILLTLFFFISVKFISYLLEYSQSSETELNNQIVIDNVETAPLDITYSKGKTLFQSNCASCHAVHKNLTGPALAGIENRVTDKKLLFAWIRNNEKVLQSGNKYFTALYENYNKTSMNLFPSLADNEIDAILYYIKDNSRQNVPSPAIIVCYFNQ